MHSEDIDYGDNMKAKLFGTALLLSCISLMAGCGAQSLGGTEGTESISESTAEGNVAADTADTAEQEGASDVLNSDLNADLTSTDIQLQLSFTRDSFKPFLGYDLDWLFGNDSESPEISIYKDDKGRTVIENASYIMIYNPLVYTENNSKYLFSGNFGSQIVTKNQSEDQSAALEEVYGNRTQEVIQPVDAGSFAANTKKPGTTGAAEKNEDISHYVGEKYDFYVYNADWTDINKTSFECIYEGEYCYMWTDDGLVDRNKVKELTEAFDEDVYRADVEAFGTARFMENGGKLNILFHSAPNNVYGYFNQADLYSSSDLLPLSPDDYMMNVDQAIIHINPVTLEASMLITKSTIAHEFQHLICFTDYVEYAQNNTCDLWANEMMSGYAESLVYPFSEQLLYRPSDYYSSKRTRNGQSLYNFEYDNTDIGCYGTVYLYAKFFKKLSDGEGPLKFHQYWRDSRGKDISVAEAFYHSLTPEYFELINNVEYSSELESMIGNKYDVFMSKMTLTYYMCTVDRTSCLELGLLGGFNSMLLYNSESPAKIEGGGRIIVAVKDGKYIIPKDADSHLIYMIFDDKFNMLETYEQY